MSKHQINNQIIEITDRVRRIDRRLLVLQNKIDRVLSFSVMTLKNKF